MVDTSGHALSPPPRMAVFLLLAALPAGLLVTLVDLLAYSRTKAALPGARPSANADAVGPALAEFAEFGPRRIVVIAGFFVVATLVFAALAWAVRRGVSRRPAVLLVATGTLSAVYLVGLAGVFVWDPVHDFGDQFIEVRGQGLVGVPWAMDTVSPGWYVPALVSVLVAAGAASVAGCVLLARPRVTSWIAGRGVVAVSARGRRGSVLLLASAPVIAVLYAVVNLVAIMAAAHAAGGGADVDDAASIARGMTLWMTGGLVVVTAGWTILGVFLRRERAWPVSMLVAGALLVVHLLVLWLAWHLQPLGADAFADDQSGLLESRPSWHAPALASFVVLGVAWPVVALVRLAMSGSAADR